MVQSAGVWHSSSVGNRIKKSTESNKQEKVNRLDSANYNALLLKRLLKKRQITENTTNFSIYSLKWNKWNHPYFIYFLLFLAILAGESSLKIERPTFLRRNQTKLYRLLVGRGGKQISSPVYTVPNLDNNNPSLQRLSQTIHQASDVGLDTTILT